MKKKTREIEAEISQVETLTMNFPIEESDNSTISVEDEQIKRTQLKMQFHSTRKGDLETIESYVKKLKSIANSLAEIDSPISDSDMVLQLLAGLPIQYFPLKNTISSKWPLPTFEYACSMVYMQEDILLQEEQSSRFYSAENFDAAVNGLGSLSAVVGAVSVVASAGWKIWQALARKMRPSWPPPSRRGRGRTGAGRGNILTQIGNQKLIAANIASTSGINTDHPMYKEFLDFVQSKQEKDDIPPSYSTVLADEESTEVVDQNDKKEVILLLEHSDLRWKNDPWKLMSRYLDSVSYTTHTYKYRIHYEMILSTTGSGEFQHFYPANTRKVYNFSKIIIKRIMTPEEWGMSPLKERDYIHPEQKIAVKYNYWDYVDSFNKALLYENTNRKHSWFIKICSHVFNQPIPNWFCKWWTLYGPSVKILPQPYKKLYSEWVDISPKLISLEQDNIFFEGMSLMYFFIEFSIPWIMKWSIEVNNTSEGFPCLQRTFYTKFWNKLLQKDPEGKIHGQEILVLINITMDKYHNTNRSQPHVDDLSPFKQIAKKLYMKKGLISKSEAIAIYMEEVKRDLMKNLKIDIIDDISIMPASDTNDDDESCMAGEAQSANSNEEIDIDALLKRLQEQVEESSSNTTCKGKGKV